MPKHRFKPGGSVPVGNHETDMLGSYFPKENWIPAITIPGIIAPGGPNGIVQHPDVTILLASCQRCGSCVEQQQWKNHITWHTNVTGT